MHPDDREPKTTAVDQTPPDARQAQRPVGDADPPGRLRARDLIILACILAVGAALRVGYFQEIRRTPEFYAPAVDAGFHDYWARGLVTGDWTPPSPHPDPMIQSSPYLRPPGYPCFLALVYSIGGLRYEAPRVAQMLLGLVNVVLAFAVVRRWLGSAVGLMAAALMATYWIFIYFEGQLQEPVLVITLLLAAVYLLTRWPGRPRWYAALAIGVVFGCCALVLPNVLVVVAGVAVWMAWVARRGSAGRAVWPSITCLILGTSLAIAPATIRNYVVSGDNVLISANAGINLYIGNNQRADGLFYGELSGLGTFGTCYDYPRLLRKLELQQGHRMRYSDFSRHFAGRALAFILDHPGRALALTFRKAVQFWGPAEISNNRVIAYERTASTVLSSVPGNFAMVASLGGLGVLLLAFRRRAHRDTSGTHARPGPCNRHLTVLLAIVPACLFLSYLPFFNTARYRVPATPFLIMFGAVALHTVWRLARARRVRATSLCVLGGLVLYVLAATPFYPYEASLAEWLFARGAAYRQLGDAPRAVAAFREALRVEPDDPRTLCNLALALSDAGRVQEAIDTWQAALRIDPGYADAHNDLGHALLRLGRFDDAEQHFAAAVRLGANGPAPYNNLANLLAARGAYDEALGLFRKALALDPGAVQPQVGIGLVLVHQGNLADAIAHYQDMIRRNPNVPELHTNLGLALMEAGRPDDAIGAYRTALRLNPSDARVYHNLGVAQEAKGNLDEAIANYKHALRIEPNLALTEKALGLALSAADRYGEAVAHLARACRLLPEDTAVQFAYAVALNATGNKEQAVARLRALVESAPNHEEARALLEQIEPSAGGR